MSMVVNILIYLSRSGAIGQNEVEVRSSVVFKPSEEMDNSIPLSDHGLSWVFKLLFAR